MEMILVAGYLPDTAKDASHKTAIAMKQVVEAMAEENQGKIVSFDVSKPGTALLFVLGDQARQTIIREFKKLQGVTVSEVPALNVHLEKNIRVQERANRMRATRKGKKA